uniref:Uncharacterized protein n=1 Tax=Arion vulgaris TaxID=1028688 RepID=A0A0B7A1U5_9EUPU
MIVQIKGSIVDTEVMSHTCLVHLSPSQQWLKVVYGADNDMYEFCQPGKIKYRNKW